MVQGTRLESVRCKRLVGSNPTSSANTKKSPILGNFLMEWYNDLNMKQTISKIIFPVYLFSVILFNFEFLFPFSYFKSMKPSDGLGMVYILCFIPVFLFLILLILNPKRFLKIRYFLINIVPFIFIVAAMSEIFEHGIGYIYQDFFDIK